MKIRNILALLMCILLAGLSAGCKVVPKPAAQGDHNTYGVRGVTKLFPFGDKPVPLEQDMLVEIRFFNRSTDMLRLMSEELPDWGGVVAPDKEVEFRTYFPVGMSEMKFFVVDESNRLLCTTWLYRTSHSIEVRSHYERYLPTLLPPPGPIGSGIPNPADNWIGILDSIPDTSPATAPSVPSGTAMSYAERPAYTPMTPYRRPVPVRSRPAGSGYNVVIADYKILGDSRTIGGGVVIGSSTNEGRRVHFGR